MDEIRRVAAEKAVEFLRDGMVIGLGTGRTASYAIRKIGEMVQSGMSFTAVSTSEASSRLAASLGLEISTLDEHPEIDVTIDGADEVDPALNLTKGKGGALVREKIIAAATKMEVIVVDSEKLVSRLGEREAIPVEIMRFGSRSTLARLTSLGCRPALRMSGSSPFVSDNGNLIADCNFSPIEKPRVLEERINMIPGVVENGIFTGLTGTVIVGRETGVELLQGAKQHT